MSTDNDPAVEAMDALMDLANNLQAENAALHMANKELVGLMSEMVEMVEEEISNREGRVSFEWECPHCEGATPMPCSLGCKVKNAIFKANKAGDR